MDVTGRTGVTGPGVRTFESFVGIVFLALLTGLLYSRFSKPQSVIQFSQKVLITILLEAIESDEKTVRAAVIHQILRQINGTYIMM